MPLFESIVNLRFEYAEGCCECVEESHGHKGRCDKSLTFENRDSEKKRAWIPFRMVPEGEEGCDDFANCRIYCRECNELILTKGNR